MMMCLGFLLELDAVLLPGEKLLVGGFAEGFKLDVELTKSCRDGVCFGLLAFSNVLTENSCPNPLPGASPWRLALSLR